MEHSRCRKYVHNSLSLVLTTGTSVFKEVHRRHSDRHHCTSWDEPGWRGEAESTEKGQETSHTDELKVTVFFLLSLFYLYALSLHNPPTPVRAPFTLSLLFLSCMTVTRKAKGQHGICVRALWVTRRWRAEALCILAVCRATLMSLIYGHFVWLGRKKWESI